MRYLAASAMIVTLAGCTAVSGPAHLQDPPAHAGPAFPGLLPSAEDRVSRRFLFQIHGIDSPDLTWANRLLEAIPAYGYERTTVTAPDGGAFWPARLSRPRLVSGYGLQCSGKPSCRFESFGKFQKDIFRNKQTGDSVTVYTYWWRPDVASISMQYLGPDITDNTIAPWTLSSRKSLANAALKMGVMDNGFSDAVAYLSPLGILEREGIETTLCTMVADAAGAAPDSFTPGAGCLGRLAAAGIEAPATVEFDFLSHSLGSRMLFDVLAPFDPDTKTARAGDEVKSRASVSRRTRTFFMAANQLPLLAPAGLIVSDDGSPLAGAPGGQSFFGLARPSRPPGGGGEPGLTSVPATLPVAIVSFQDPDDLLGFKASDALLGAKAPGVTIVDITHRNTDQWAFLFARPDLAHDHELQEPHSLRMILCGAESDSAGQLQPDRCRK